MRFIVRLVNLTEKPLTVDLDYRRRFISLLKTIFGTETFQNSETRPYTFAVYFGKEAKVKDGFIENVNLINFRFSTGDNLTAVRFYNGILRLKRQGYIHEIGTGKLFIERIESEKEKKPTGYFRTLSPVVVERIGFSDRKDRYTVPSDKDFTESLLENIIRRFIAINENEPKFSRFSFEPVSIREEVIKHYGGYLKGFLGKFKIKTDSNELLDFIYKFGLGLRTGQGFGYLEVEDGKA